MDFEQLRHLVANDRKEILRVLPLGGIGDFGMNFTSYIYKGRNFLVDAGIRFSDPKKLGTSAMMPELEEFVAATGGIYSYILTHGHEDHIGAIPHLLQRWPAPVYGTQWTIELIKNKLQRFNLNPENFRLHVVEAGDRIIADDFDVEFIHVNHSIPMTCALYIKTLAGNVFHTGDYKFDESPVIESTVDWHRLNEISTEGVDLLIGDSTNAEKEGNCPGESTVCSQLIKVFANCSNAIFCTTFASNLWRLKIIADACIATARKLYIAGGGLEQTISIARTTGLYEFPSGLRIGEEELPHLDRGKIVVLATGSQGESRSAMMRLAAGEFRTFAVMPGDTVVMSARVIPGNERPVIYMLNELLKCGANVVTSREVSGIHVSGHAYGGDIAKLIKALKPKKYVPMHGAYSQLKANREIAKALKQDEISTSLILSGDLLVIENGQCTPLENIDVPLRYIEAEGRGTISSDGLRERLKIGELGLVIVNGVYSPESQKWLAEPTFDFIGVELDSIQEESFVLKCSKFIDHEIKDGQKDDFSENVRVFVRRQLQIFCGRRPVVIVKINAV